MEDWDKVLGVLGLKLVNLVVGAFSSFVALNFWRGVDSSRERWVTFIGGWAVAAWGGPPLREWLELKPSLEIGIVLALGLFGMALVAELLKLIRETDWKSVAAAIFRWKTGGGGDSKP